MLGHFAGFGQLGVDWQHVVAPIKLHGVPCVIKHAHTLLALQRIFDFDNRLSHLRLGAIAHFNDCKTQAAQRLAHGFGIVTGVDQSCVACIGCVTDDQGYAQVTRRLGAQW